jgi:hypothetical protein
MVHARRGGSFLSMRDRYAPALFLEVLAFWFILRRLLTARLVLFFGRVLILLMLVGVLGTLDERRFVWVACFAGSTLLGVDASAPMAARIRSSYAEPAHTDVIRVARQIGR